LVSYITKLTPKNTVSPTYTENRALGPIAQSPIKPLVPNWSVIAAYLGDRVASVKRAAVPEMCFF
jgi:hypothetical protein